MKNNKTLLGILSGVLIFAGIFAWLVWGSHVPSPTVKSDNGVTITPKVKNSTISRTVNGKKLWEFTVGEVVSQNEDNMAFKDIKGKVYLDNGDVMDITAGSGKAQVKNNDFKLESGVLARLQKGGFLKAESVEWLAKSDVLTALGKEKVQVKLIKDDIQVTADQLTTSSKLEQVKAKGNALLEKGGQYDEN
jgi:hypothetical protein